MSLSCDSKVSLSLRTFLINFSKTKDYSEDSDASEQFGNIEDVLRLLRISNYESYTKSIKENNPRLKTAKDLLKLDKDKFEEILTKAGVKKGHRVKLIKLKEIFNVCPAQDDDESSSDDDDYFMGGDDTDEDEDEDEDDEDDDL
mmetsp:Transcript_13128/g.15583  ORF Transcript_13128/g.15583 Transcript_13128/m.15583 type:complete len:144 (+) Transcript_13128:112-543(+)|eukprot:jgi/Bigna1/85698/estExt_fgenesh1_pg.C_50249